MISVDELRAAMYHEAFEEDSDLQKWEGGCWIRYKLFENVLDSILTIDLPDTDVEKLNDEERRIFLAAMHKEKSHCQNIEELWDLLSLSSDDDIDLVKTCEEIVRKVKKVLWTEELENDETDD